MLCSREAAWPSSKSAGFEIHRSRVQIPFRSLADVVLGSPQFNFSATLVNSQLFCLPSVGILNLVMFIYPYLFTLVLESPDGKCQITYPFLIHSKRTSFCHQQHIPRQKQGNHEMA